MENEGYSSSRFKSEVSTPKETSEIYQEIIQKILPFIDASKLIDTENLEKLKELKEKYKRGDNFFASTVDEILRKIVCQNCNSILSFKHYCKSLICKNCVQQNNYECTHCHQRLSNTLIRKLFNISFNCIICSQESELNCKHLCEQCLFDDRSIEVTKIINGCAECYEFYNNKKKEVFSCSNCSENKTRENMLKFCRNHLLCTDCASAQIERGKCLCEFPINISRIQIIYERTHFACQNCNYCFRESERKELMCCKRAVCNTCNSLSCLKCNIPTFPQFY